MRILLINGPNLQLLGRREPDVYGSTTLADIEAHLRKVAAGLKIEIECFQSNSEGKLVDRIGEAMTGVDGIIINPAAYTHTSVAIRDAIAATALPSIEVHISNVHQRDAFRQHSYIAPVCLGQIIGLGVDGYEWALRALHRHLAQTTESSCLNRDDNNLK